MLVGDGWASMRPRVFPAEDWMTSRTSSGSTFGFNEAAGIPRGRQERISTRPAKRRSFNEAAGIPRGRRCDVLFQVQPPGPASMRPRVFPAEDAMLTIRRVGPTLLASMRPRVFPAEDEPRKFDRPDGTRASMRPRVFPAEDPKKTAPKAAPKKAAPLQ